MKRKYDIIVWGATGFTGKLVTEYVGKNYPTVRWAVAGRNESKLCAVLSELSLTETLNDSPVVPWFATLT